MLVALLTALLLSPQESADVPVIAPERAKDYVGRDVVVQGRVMQVGASKDNKTLFLNFAGQYPYHEFNAVILGRNLRSFPEARSWAGKTVRIRGTVQLYKGRGKPEILLERREQVTIDSGPEPPREAVPEASDYESPPRPIKITRPEYPAEAFARKIEGTVLVEILIDAQGRVVRARILESIPLLDAAALQTVYQWTFQPATKDGRPVATIAHAPVAFRIYGRETRTEQRNQRP